MRGPKNRDDTIGKSDQLEITVSANGTCHQTNETLEEDNKHLLSMVFTPAKIQAKITCETVPTPNVGPLAETEGS